MSKPALESIPSFYHNYVKLAPDGNVAEALANNTTTVRSFLKNIPEDKWDYRYAEGKWSIKEMVQHLIDAERIFAYRALCIARGESQSLPGFDENTYAASVNPSNRSKEELLEEFSTVRKSNEILFRSLGEENLTRTGIANNNPISANAIGFITVGHALHHLNVLKERYLA